MRQNLLLLLRCASGEQRKAGKLVVFRGKRVLYHYAHPQNLKAEAWGFFADALRFALEHGATEALLGTKREFRGGSEEQTYAVPIGFFSAHGSVADREKWGASVLLPACMWEPLFLAMPYVECAERVIDVTQQPWLGDSTSLIIETDGGMDGGNPGPIGAGVVIRDSAANVLHVLSHPLGHGTNNEAEYGALLHALRESLRLGARAVRLRSDSELMVKQMRGEFAVKDAKIKPLHAQARELAMQIPTFEITWIPREQNRLADEAAGKAARENATQSALL